MRVDEPILSIVVTLRNAESRSGARVPGAPCAFELIDAGNEAWNLGGYPDGIEAHDGNQFHIHLHPFSRLNTGLAHLLTHFSALPEPRWS